MTAADVLTFTRLAGDKVGATKMDRPEDVEPSLLTGKVYVALTNNSDRGKAGKAPADEANPRNSNKHGQILELVEDRGDNTAETFAWSLPIVCGDPADASTYFAGYDKTKVSPISCPDNVASRRHRQPVDLDRRQRAGQQRRPVRHRRRGSGAGPPEAVPHRAARRGDLRPVHHR
ncbi:alkaline phosphatase PhoX [Micromonospora sp. BRA006-A]|nr:alkaline phosphatase PhoX [Micromonospora sp. BRA006-A]